MALMYIVDVVGITPESLEHFRAHRARILSRAVIIVMIVPDVSKHFVESTERLLANWTRL